MIFFLFLLDFSSILADTWVSTSTLCIWHQYTINDRLSTRIDLRDIRNEILKVTVNDSIYYFNPCKTFNLPVNTDPYSVQGEQCHNVLGCKQVKTEGRSDRYYTNAIRLNSTVLSRVSSLTIRYNGAKSYANRTIYVRFDCQRRLHQAELKLIKYGRHQMPIFSLSHRCCCSNVCGGNTFPQGLLLVLLLVILFIIATAVWIFFQCRRHYPERNNYGAIASADMNIGTLEPSQVLKLNVSDGTARGASNKRTRSRSIVPVLDNSILSSQDFKIIQRLGVGELGGEVSEGRWKDKLIAIKTLRIGIHPEKFSAQDKTYLEEEIGRLSRLRQKNLTAIIGICFDVDLYPRIILSFAEHGTIIDFIRRFPTKVDWTLRLTWCLNTSDALVYLHQSNILHRNLKSSNILIGVDLRAHVCDYGLISVLQPLRQACDSERCLCKLSHPALPISIRWSAPEILADPSDPTQFQPACDVYSFGVCLWEQIRLEQPYTDVTDEAEVCRMIVGGYRLTLSEETISTLLPDYYQLMNDCWNENPSHRPSFEQISQVLRTFLPKAKAFQKMSTKRLSSITTATDAPDEHSLLYRLDSRISTSTAKSFHPTI